MSIEQERAEPPQEKGLADLIGLWDTGEPPLTDHDLDRILEEELLKKYG